MSLIAANVISQAKRQAEIQALLDSNHTLTNISNYSGIFVQGNNYEKFDFVYNTGDGLFYYAKEDITDGGNTVVSGKNRFTLDPNGPIDNGEKTYYIYDELQEVSALGNSLKVGQTFNLQGSLNGADGSYSILDIEHEFDEVPLADNQTSNVITALSASSLGPQQWYKSSWFLKSNSSGYEFDFTDFFLSSSSNSSWIYNSALGLWMYVHAITASSVWFWFGAQSTSLNNGGAWMYASQQEVQDGYIYIADDASDNRFGPAGNWLFMAVPADPNYVLALYNTGNQKWYGIESGASDVREIIPPFAIQPGTPSTSPPGRDVDGISSRIQIKKANTSSEILNFETKGNNNIILTALNFSPSNSPDKWTKDKFFFDADYGSKINFKSDIHIDNFGNGYYSVRPRSINTLQFDIDLNFKARTNKEANAIIHFVENHQGQHEKDMISPNLKYSQGISGFRWDGSSTFHPYDSVDMQSKKFYCTKFSHQLNFENNNDITISLSNYDTSLLKKSEELFIKRPEDYDAASFYEKNDIVFSPENHTYYYWSGDEGATNKPPVTGNQSWTRESGYFTDINTEYWSREFFWKPSLGLSVDQEPRLLKVSAENGYNQLYSDGINESLLELNLNFNNRDDEEAYSMLHFLEQHYGAQPFRFTPPAPYDRTQNFICDEWSHVYNFKNNHSISAKFHQYPFNFSAQEIDSSASPPNLVNQQLKVPNPITLSTSSDPVSRLNNLRHRVLVENVGDYPLEIQSILINGNNNESFYLLGGSRWGGVNQQSIPVVISDSSANLNFTIPSSPTLPFNLNGEAIVLKPNFQNGKEGGQSFVVKSTDETFFQLNNGTIIKGTDQFSCSYFVADQFFRENSVSTIQPNGKAFFDIVFEGQTVLDKFSYLVDGSGNKLMYDLGNNEDLRYEAFVNKFHNIYWLKNSVLNKNDPNFGKLLQERLVYDASGNVTDIEDVYVTKAEFGRQKYRVGIDILPELTGPISIGVSNGFYRTNITINSNDEFSPQTSQVRVYIE